MMVGLTPERKQESPFVLPKSLEEVLITLAMVAWPFIWWGLLMPDHPNTFGKVVGWIVVLGVWYGMFLGLQTARKGRNT